MTALVSDLIFSDIRFGSNPNVFSSISEKIGVAFTNRTQFAVEIKEKEGTITLSPFFIPYDSNTACKAEVPELTAIQ
jgi:hypothetical protein